MSISWEGLRAFVAVAEEGHFGRAAERLHMTQPPLSRRIQALEQSLGVTLVERTSRGSLLTPAGQELLVEARRLLAHAEEVPERVRLVADGFEGRLRVGFTASAAHAVLGRLLAEADLALPGVEIVLGEHVSSVQIAQLLEGTLDLGIMRPSSPPAGLASRRIHRECMLVAVPTGHPLTGVEGPVDPADLARHRMITYQQRDATYFADLSARILRGARPRSVHRVAQIHSMISLVAAGRGVALVPESAAAVYGGEIVLLPIAGWEEPVAELHAVWSRTTARPTTQRALAELSAIQEIAVAP